MLSHFNQVQFFVTPWTVGCQAPLSMGFSRQECWSGLPCPPPGYLECSCFPVLWWFLLYSKVNQLYILMYSPFFELPSHLGHHRQLSRVLCAIKLVFISYLFYT